MLHSVLHLLCLSVKLPLLQYYARQSHSLQIAFKTSILYLLLFLHPLVSSGEEQHRVLTDDAF